MELGKAERICGEMDPGFNIWTSAHGFSHYKLSDRKVWRRVWAAVLILCVLALLLTSALYLYQTLSSGVFSSVRLAAVTGPWPRTLVCDRQGLRSAKVDRARLSSRLAAYLTWSFHPSLVMNSDHTIFRLTVEDGERELADILRFRREYNGSFDSFLSSMMPTCEEVILECQVGVRPALSAKDCCQQIFDPKPHLTVKGTCFSTRPGVGDSREGLTVTTQHQELDMDTDLGSPDLVSGVGAAVAVVEDNLSPAAAMLGHGVAVHPDTQVDIAVTPTTIDNTQLSSSLIGLQSCLQPEDEVEEHLNLNQEEFGYSHANCLLSRTEVRATSSLGCSFVLTNTTKWRRCTPQDSSNFAGISLEVEGEEEDCPSDCLHTMYSLAVSRADLTDTVKLHLRDKVPSGQNIKAIVMKLSMASTDFMVISNRPQPVLQFLAEIGGLMAFFLGTSVISLMECCCYGATKVSRKYKQRQKMKRVRVDGGEEGGERRGGTPPVLVSETDRRANKTGAKNKARSQK